MIHPQDLQEMRDSSRTAAKYVVLKDYLLGRMASNELKPGDALPTEQVLADSLGVARNTVRQALTELVDRGLIYRVRGRGTFVSEHLPPSSPRNAFTRRSLSAEPAAPTRPKNDLEMLALVVADLEEQYTQTLLRGFEEEATKNRSQIVVCCTNEDVCKQADVFMQVLDRGVSGVALWPTFGEDTPAYQVRHLQRFGVPVVLCHRPVEGATAPFVGVSFVDVARLAGEAFLRHGHRRVAMFVSSPSLASRAYEQTLRQVMREGGGELPDDFIYCGNSQHWDMSQQEPMIAAALERMLAGPNRPTAIFSGFHTTAEVIYLAAQRLRLSIPDDLSIISVGGVRREGIIANRLSTVAIDAAGLGRRAAELLHEMHLGRRPIDNTERFLMPLELQVNGTLARCPA